MSQSSSWVSLREFDNGPGDRGRVFVMHHVAEAGQRNNLRMPRNTRLHETHH